MPKLPQNAARRKLSKEAIAVTPGDYFALLARQTSASTKNVADDELTWFAIEVVEWMWLQDSGGENRLRRRFLMDGEASGCGTALPGNLKPAKDRSAERIDDIVALIMALGRAMVAKEQVSATPMPP